MSRSVDVAVLPSEALSMEADAYIVVDALRATTVMATLFSRGLEDLVVVDNQTAARTRAAADGRILFGEIGGLPPEGFDYGNSPLEAAQLELAGRGAVHFTGNGTRTLCSVADRGAVAAGSMSNLSACAAWAVRFERICIVCAGDHGATRFSLEDFSVAGSIVRKMAHEAANLATGDAAGVAMELSSYEDLISPSLPQQTGRSARFITGSTHARDLVRLGFGADVQFATQEDTSTAVPVIVDHGPGWARLQDQSA